MRKHLVFLMFGILSAVSAECQSKIVVGFLEQADDSIKTSAKLLAEELNKAVAEIAMISQIKNTSEANIILISKSDLQLNGFSANEISALKKQGVEGFGIIGKARRMYITGNSSLGIQNGVSKYLFSLGFRYYFPQPEWIIYPKEISYYLKTSIFSSPVFAHRYLWYGFGPGTEKVESRFQFWKKMNCLYGSLEASTGHSYDLIVERNKKEFLQHPEWLVNASNSGVTTPNPKFDISKVDLVKLVVKDTREKILQLKKAGSPGYKMISLSPSDGLGTCDTKDCQKLGSISDRVFHLVNIVARSIRKEFPNTLIGCLAYSEYIAPPAKLIESNVYVALTTAFNNSEYSLDELIKRWSKKVKKLGIYDYQALYAWDYDLPGQSLASAYHLIQPSLSKYAKAGIIGYEAEVNTGWVNKGLGYYISSQLLWNPSIKSEAIAEEFFAKCFESSASIVKKLYAEWSQFNDPFISANVLYRWIDLLTGSISKEKNEQVVSRLEMLGSYLQYLVVYNKYKSDPSQLNLNELIQLAKLHMNDECVTYYPAMVVLGGGLDGFNLNATIRQNGVTPFSFSAKQTIQWLKQYRAGVGAIKEYKKPQLSKNLSIVPGGKTYNLSLHDVKEDQNSYVNTTYFVFEQKDPRLSFFEVQADFIEGGGSKLPVRISLYTFKGYTVPKGMPLLEFNYRDRKKWNKYSLASLPKGTYVLKVEDPKKGFQLKLSPGLNYSLFIPENTKLEVGYIHSLYFYVPPGTKSFKFMKTRTMKLIDPLGVVYDHANNKQEEFEIAPTAQQAGVWRLMGVSEFFKPEGIYPIFGVIPSRMLYPQ